MGWSICAHPPTQPPSHPHTDPLSQKPPIHVQAHCHQANPRDHNRCRTQLHSPPRPSHSPVAAVGRIGCFHFHPPTHPPSPCLFSHFLRSPSSSPPKPLTLNALHTSHPPGAAVGGVSCGVLRPCGSPRCPSSTAGWWGWWGSPMTPGRRPSLLHAYRCVCVCVCVCGGQPPALSGIVRGGGTPSQLAHGPAQVHRWQAHVWNVYGCMVHTCVWIAAWCTRVCR